MLWHKWSRGTICDNTNGPGGPFMLNIMVPRTTYARTIYVVTVPYAYGMKYVYGTQHHDGIQKFQGHVKGVAK